MSGFSRKGFTLIELLVVVLIVGILASMGVPYYLKTVETSKATNASAIGHLIGSANRMWHLDKTMDNISSNDYVEGQIIDSCNTASCSDQTSNKCNLVACNYVAKQPWDQGNTSAYLYYACNPSGSGGGCCAKGAVSCVKRREGKFKDWGYRFTDSGGCSAFGEEVPSCPGI